MVMNAAHPRYVRHGILSTIGAQPRAVSTSMFAIGTSQGVPTGHGVDVHAEPYEYPARHIGQVRIGTTRLWARIVPRTLASPTERRLNTVSGGVS